MRLVSGKILILGRGLESNKCEWNAGGPVVDAEGRLLNPGAGIQMAVSGDALESPRSAQWQHVPRARTQVGNPRTCCKSADEAAWSTRLMWVSSKVWWGATECNGKSFLSATDATIYLHFGQVCLVCFGGGHFCSVCVVLRWRSNSNYYATPQPCTINGGAEIASILGGSMGDISCQKNLT